MIGRIKRTPEPLSTASKLEPSILAESTAYDLLIRELSLYAEEFIGGRSFLISGHRGSGKTTLVYKAIQDLSRRFREENQLSYLLPVPLHGPDLLTSTSIVPAPKNSDGTLRNEAASKKHKNGVKPGVKAEQEHEPVGTQRVLIQITIALYRALANEMAYAFQKRVEKNLGGDRPELLELAAQLKLELDDLSNVSILREFWEKAGLLDSGALFDEEVVVSHSHHGQGILELVALSNAAQAYRVVTGRIEGQEIRELDAQNMQEFSLSTKGQSSGKDGPITSSQMKDLLHSLLGLLAGGIVGIGAISQTTNTFLAAFAAVITALLTIFSLNLVSSRSRSQAVSKNFFFIRDYSITTLSRELPILINRLREANIAPVFVVDELDKVTLPFEHIGLLVGHLKQFVTERSFFCFLTDRNYYEYLEYKLRTLPFPKEHTYFTHRIFVLYRPKDLREFLMAILEPIEDALFFDIVANEMGPSTNQFQYPGQFAANCELFSYILLHWARLHPFSLGRELSKFIRFSSRLPKDSLVAVPDDLLSDLGYRFTIMFQVAIEWLLSQKELSNRLLHDPYFGQYTYDALYYPSRSWANGDQILELSKEAFREYLEDRIGERYLSPIEYSDTPLSENLGPGNDNDHERKKRVNEGFHALLSENDFIFLYEQTRELISLILEPANLVEKLQTTLSTQQSTSGGYGPALLELIPREQPDLRLLEVVAQNRYRWRFDNYGRPLSGTKIQTTPLESLNNADFISKFSQSVSELTEGRLTLDSLANNFNILSISPQWLDVQMAIARLQEYEKTGKVYEKLDPDQLLIDEYLKMILLRGVGLGCALALGAAIGQAAGGKSRGESLVRGLESLAILLDFKSMRVPSQIEEAIGELDVGFDEDLRRKLILRTDQLSDWIKNVNNLIEKKTREIV